ncbi:MAG: hypothetical protein H0V49_01645, partial [Nocardioidaceae bacterium]|nr:hypothetical protein [Nocardioidaceae bacterium]
MTGSQAVTDANASSQPPMAGRHPMTGNRMTGEGRADEHGFEEHHYDVVVIGA